MKLTLRQVEELPAIHFANSYSRLGAVLELWDDPQISAAIFYRVLGRQWSVCDNIAAHIDQLYMVLAEGAPLEFIRKRMMTPTEHAAYDALPDTLTIYRGCGEVNECGWSWTLNRETAEKFPTLLRYKAADPRVLTGTVQKDDVVALKLDRDETEIIVNPDDVSVTSKELLEPAAL